MFSIFVLMYHLDFMFHMTTSIMRKHINLFLNKNRIIIILYDVGIEFYQKINSLKVFKELR